MFQFFADPDFVKSLKKLDLTIQEEIKKKLEFFSGINNSLVFSKKMQGYKNIFRFRVGQYRILFKLEENKITLLLVKHRKDIYKEF